MQHQAASNVNPLKHPSVRDVWPQSVRHERTFDTAEFTGFLDEALKPSRSPQNEAYADFFLLLGEKRACASAKGYTRDGVTFPSAMRTAATCA